MLTPYSPPVLRGDLPLYPQPLQLVRTTGGTTTGPGSVTLYLGETQQLMGDTLARRDREPCYGLDMRGLGLDPDYYLGRLSGSYNDIPVYELISPGGGGSGSPDAPHETYQYVSADLVDWVLPTPIDGRGDGSSGQMYVLNVTESGKYIRSVLPIDNDGVQSFHLFIADYVYDITISNEDGAGTASARILTPGGVDYILSSYDYPKLTRWDYDADAERWRVTPVDPYPDASYTYAGRVSFGDQKLGYGLKYVDGLVAGFDTGPAVDLVSPTYYPAAIIARNDIVVTGAAASGSYFLIHWVGQSTGTNLEHYDGTDFLTRLVIAPGVVGLVCQSGGATGGTPEDAAYEITMADGVKYTGDTGTLGPGALVKGGLVTYVGSGVYGTVTGADDCGYAPGDSGDWSGDPATVAEAIDRLAAVVSLGGTTPIP